MKFTLSWLKDHLDTKASLEKICDTLTMIGLEVESASDRTAELKPFTVAKIISAEKHPQADKLKLCRVESDAGELQIVCGAANARDGLYVALAKEGAVTPNGGMVIKKTKIRGVESSGMLCSAEELGLDMPGDGIIELPPAKIGESIVSVLGLDDPVIDVAITPNRADALGVRGIARDLAAAGLGTLKTLPDISGVKGSFPSPTAVSISTPNCQQFIGASIKGVKNAQSPDWLRKRLAAIGQKSISALVDITNYITIDLGRPLHVYDAKKLKGDIAVRDAKAGEKLKALDDKEYALSPGMCVIADDSGVLGLGGIIGGASTGCDEHTTDVFLEVALFNPAHVAKTGRTLQIDTDARYRFERGVDVAFVETSAKLAIKMIKELCGGEASELVVVGKPPAWQRTIALRFDRIATLGSVAVDKARAAAILHALGFGISEKGAAVSVTPPPWRADIEGEADLVEEILRILGYDKIPATPLPKLPTIGKPALNLMQQRTRIAKRALAARGFMEACTYSFLPHTQAKMFGGGAEALQLQNPISEELSDMRPSLLPNLLEAAKKNTFRGFKDLALCEVGLQFSDTTPHGQRMVATGVRSGEIPHNVATITGYFTKKGSSITVFDAKVDALALLEALGIQKCDITTGTPAWYHPGRSGALVQGKNVLGYFGELHPAIVKDFEIETAAGFEIFLDTIPAPKAKGKARAALRLSDFQAVKRDFAFVVDEKITAAEILKVLSQAKKELITNIEIFDVYYTNKDTEAGKKSVAVMVTLQSFERTLTEADITAVSQAIVEAAKSFGGALRQ